MVLIVGASIALPEELLEKMDEIASLSSERLPAFEDRPASVTTGQLVETLQGVVRDAYEALQVAVRLVYDIDPEVTDLSQHQAISAGIRTTFANALISALGDRLPDFTHYVRAIVYTGFNFDISCSKSYAR